MQSSPQISPDYQFEIEFLQSIRNRQPNDLPVLEMLASYLTRAGYLNQGLEIDQQIVQLDPENPTSHYNLACSHALKDDFPNALQSLQQAIELGYDDFDWMRQDPDLETLRQHTDIESFLDSQS